MLTIDNWIVCWTPARWREEAEVWEVDVEMASGIIHVAQLGDDVYWSRRYAYVTGTCWTDRHSMTIAQKVMMMFIDFHTCVVRDGINPQAANREFLKIDEYHRRISPDTPGVVLGG